MDIKDAKVKNVMLDGAKCSHGFNPQVCGVFFDNGSVYISRTAITIGSSDPLTTEEIVIKALVEYIETRCLTDVEPDTTGTQQARSNSGAG